MNPAVNMINSLTLLFCFVSSSWAFNVNNGYASHSNCKKKLSFDLPIAGESIMKLYSQTTSNNSDSNKDDDKKDLVEAGSTEYLEGFVTSPMKSNDDLDRGTGLEQSLKLAGGFAAVLVVLFIGFMASNGLI